MRGKDSRVFLAKRQCQSVEQLIRAVPNVFVWARAEIGMKVVGISLPDCAVYAISANQQITLPFQSVDVADFISKMNSNPELFAACLENLEQPDSRDPGKAVAVNRNLIVAMHHVDIVPGFELTCDLGM